MREWSSDDGSMTLILGEWQSALHGVEADALVCDPPYSERTHKGHDAGATLANRGSWRRSGGGADRCRPRREISYTHWTADDQIEFAESWAPRCKGWSVLLSDSEQSTQWRAAWESLGRTGFHPLPVVIPGMSVRLSGDGPSSWAIYANVSRPKALHKWGTLPGAYIGKQGERVHIGGKPLWLMRALIRDYTRPGDLVCDPCAGSGTTLLAAAMEGRRAIGAEIDKAAFDAAVQRLSGGYTPSFDFLDDERTTRCPPSK